MIKKKKALIRKKHPLSKINVKQEVLRKWVLILVEFFKIFYK